MTTAAAAITVQTDTDDIALRLARAEEWLARPVRSTRRHRFSLRSLFSPAPVGSPTFTPLIGGRLDVKHMNGPVGVRTMVGL